MVREAQHGVFMRLESMKRVMDAISYRLKKPVYNGVKVCQYLYDGVLSSAMAGCNVYGIGMLAKPNRGCGPLCVYNNLKNATKSFRIGGSFRAYSCLYVPSNEDKVWIFDAERDLEVLPPGTMLADVVMLTRWLT